ncbi:hypothetical protein [Denitromonas iodatirespirans]|uniref:Uncharacterized protein n=1 Tax=Denitromonas iodatirespirans TaxID=2795389 RepID=A0A944DG77_DENI1|nr:hypothetical protein [Denitromonas iodatirespirans]MBT0963763.1 hypothetical protein [Denitromonas iodatirespirans]
MQIQQLQVAYDARADRLLLRIASAQREEIGVLITRRLLKALWPALQRMLNSHLSAKPLAAHDPGGESSPRGGRFDAPFDGDKLTHPLGTEPLLAAESRLQPLEGPLCRIMLGEPGARQVSFDCDRDLMEALCAMLRGTVTKAEWDLPLDDLPLPEALTGGPSDLPPTVH